MKVHLVTVQSGCPKCLRVRVNIVPYQIPDSRASDFPAQRNQPAANDRLDIYNYYFLFIQYSTHDVYL
jgi:hypothetical protein